MNNVITSIEKAIVATIVQSTTVGQIDDYLDALDYLFERRRLERFSVLPTNAQDGASE